MATKAELLEKARKSGLDVKTKATKAELESMLGADGNGNAETNRQETEVTVARLEKDSTDENGEPETEELKNTDSVPQNDVTGVNVLDNDADGLAVKEDPERQGTDAVKFADEANPNRKSRRTGDGGSDFDQDGNPRTGGKSYGVSADSEETPTEVFSANNAGDAPEGRDNVPMGEYLNPEPGSEQDTNNGQWEKEDVTALEESLSEPENQIVARVSTAMGKYVRVKFFRNGLAFGTYKSRDFDEGKASQYLADLKESVGL